jgi:hypothetical protein
LGQSRVQQAEATVAEDDVRDAPAERQEWLRERLGRPICSVVQEEGELVKSAADRTTPLETRFQVDALRGPAKGEGGSLTNNLRCDITLSCQHAILNSPP